MSTITKYVCDYCNKDDFKEKDLRTIYLSEQPDRIDLCNDCVYKLLRRCLVSGYIVLTKYCETCKGEGKIKTVKEYASCSYDRTEYEYKPCPDCGAKNG